MARFTTRLIAIVCASLMLLGVLAVPAMAAPGGNAGGSAACENGGYRNYTDANGNAFKNEGQCVKYAAKGNTLVPVVTEDPAVTRCKQEAAAAGFDPSAFTIITGTEGDVEALTPTAGPDLICGFGGTDVVDTLSADDVFLGGAGNDVVRDLYGTFNGGDGSDQVSPTMHGGTFNGGDGSDQVSTMNGGTFNGGAGREHVSAVNGGVFNAGAGTESDYVSELFGGTFNGNDGPNSVVVMYDGIFNGGAGADRVEIYYGGTFNQD
jgi:Ca2+-binding RTX toxin-like protein